MVKCLPHTHTDTHLPRQMIADLVTTAISRQDRAPRLFTHTTTLSPVGKREKTHTWRAAVLTVSMIHDRCHLVNLISAADAIGCLGWSCGLSLS